MAKGDRANLLYRRRAFRWSALILPALVITWGFLGAAETLAAPKPGGLTPIRTSPAEPDRLTAEQQRELEHLVDDLRDAKLDFDRRKRAASILLDRGWAAGVSALRRQLLEADAVAHRAIAQAAATITDPPIDLLQPLIALLSSEDAGLRDDAAAALGRYESASVAEQLADLCNDRRQPAALRRGAIRALAFHRTKPAAQSLLSLTQDGDASVRDAAFSGLALLSGVDLGPDAEAWRQWWQSVRKLDNPQWLAMLVRNLAAVNTAQARQLQSVTERMLAAQNSVYEATPETGRTAILQQMLVDPMQDMRLLALKLIERRVLNAQPVAPEVRTAMRQRLDDRSPDVRIQTAKLLENLADPEGAQMAIQLLLGETDPRVQAAYLGVLARVPQAAAVEPALLVIERPMLRSAAAAVIVAAHDAKLLSPEQAGRALGIARFHLVDNDEPDPMMLRLLARLGDESDQPLITVHLTNKDAATRVAAAEAYISSDWKMAALMDHLDDPVLWPVIIQGTAKRAARVETLLGLLRHEPREQSQLPPWREAALAVATRLDLDGLARADQELAAMPERRDLHEDVLKAAAGLLAAANAQTTVGPGFELTGDSEERRVEAAFRLAGFYITAQQPSKAKAVYERLDARTNLSEPQRRRLAAARLALLLEGLNYEEATEVSRKLIAEPAPLALEVLAEPWLTAAERALEANLIETARTLTLHASGLFARNLKPPASDRLAELQARLLTAKPAAPAPAPPAAAPAKKPQPKAPGV